MKQYCRYCAWAIDYNGECTEILCTKNDKWYSASTAKSQNNCKEYCFNENDVFGFLPNGRFKTYQPREAYKPKAIQAKEAGQINLFAGSEETK